MRTRWLLAAGAASLLAASVSAGTLRGTETFYHITNNSGLVSEIESQLVMEIWDVTGVTDQVDFKFYWSSLDTTASLTDVYWDDGSLLGIAAINPDGAVAGVSFDDPASPGDLPGPAKWNFNTTSNFSVDSDTPGLMENGVNQLSEYLVVRFDLIAGQDVDDVLTALALAETDPDADLVGGLRVGAHVQSIDGGTSDTFITVRTIPLPSGAALAGLGLFVVPAIRRRPIAG